MIWFKCTSQIDKMSIITSGWWNIKICFGFLVPVPNKMKTSDSIAGIYFLFSLTMSASEDLFRPHNRLLKCQKVHPARDTENIDWWGSRKLHYIFLWWGWCVNNKLWVNLRQIKNKILLNVPTPTNNKWRSYSSQYLWRFLSPLSNLWMDWLTKAVIAVSPTLD